MRSGEVSLLDLLDDVAAFTPDALVPLDLDFSRLGTPRAASSLRSYAFSSVNEIYNNIEYIAIDFFCYVLSSKMVLASNSSSTMMD